MSVSCAANLMKDLTTFGDMSNPTRITINSAVGSAQKVSIVQTYFNDMSWLMLEQHVTVLEKCRGQAKLKLCYFAAIHALANQVWDLQQQLTLLFSASKAKRRRMESWCMNQQRDLYQDLITIRMYCDRHVAHHEIRLLLECVMMALHAPMAHMQRFAGKEGEIEARRVAPIVSEWKQSSTARVAIRHADQVLRRARQFPPTTLQNLYAAAKYHAALVLWAYSILVMLDGEENDDSRAFCTLWHGTPGLSHPAYTGVPRTFCTLIDPALTMQLAGDTLRGNLVDALVEA
ncbi:uncharacterized protein FMAN_05301 [Fusarium mangiferae]|uniref:Uncharacterized protein n=1 Tax=Fusarium mangiferae TaxID=192010 RepID=A0A1L7SXQ8_FUSMA|nr:uncharacterized protein FMAN_05301 [Fusarium mangiferae]CVK87881.1 uncharacterized protein FMAN_05301 [Fusarium mangiferae]